MLSWQIIALRAKVARYSYQLSAINGALRGPVRFRTLLGGTECNFTDQISLSALEGDL